MNREEAKQFLPLIQAFAEGKQLQIQTIKSKWGDLIGEPLFNVSPENYRIKPEKKTGWLNIYLSDAYMSGSYSSIYLTKTAADSAAQNSRIACIQISYEEGEGL